MSWAIRCGKAGSLSLAAGPDCPIPCVWSPTLRHGTYRDVPLGEHVDQAVVLAYRTPTSSSTAEDIRDRSSIPCLSGACGHEQDIIDRGLLNLAVKRIRRRLRFSEEELAKADAMHAHLLAQLRLAAAVLMGGDLAAAQRLVQEKERFRDLERAATQGEFARLQEGRRRLDTSGLLLDAVRDLKRVEAHLAAIAHPLLERSNLLRPTRLVRLPRTGEAGGSH